MEIEGILLLVGLCPVSAITQEFNENPIAFLERLKEALQKVLVAVWTISSKEEAGYCCCSCCNLILISDAHWDRNLSFKITCPS